jgi:SAM-dependent methyltransferase
MNETSKTKLIWTDFERGLLQGEGIDIGCGGDPIFESAVPFDVQHGDANRITEYVDRRFDYVYSSHCLEHMLDPQCTIQEWWALVRPGGVLFVIVPDEDLYEQGYWPSRFNSDHKWTFTLSKSESWSPVSINVLELVSSLPGSELVDVRLQDHGYDHRLLGHGLTPGTLRYRLHGMWRKQLSSLLARLRIISKDQKRRMRYPVDQTNLPGVLAQIQFIARKLAE